MNLFKHLMRLNNLIQGRTAKNGGGKGKARIDLKTCRWLYRQHGHAISQCQTHRIMTNRLVVVRKGCRNRDVKLQTHCIRGIRHIGYSRLELTGSKHREGENRL